MNIKVKRIYETAAKADGDRLLVDRLWPRGVSKEDASITAWLKVLAPSNKLRAWFHADPEKRFKAFQKQYRAELTENRAAVVAALAPYKGTVTFVTAVKDPAHSHIPVLRAFAIRKLK